MSTLTTRVTLVPESNQSLTKTCRSAELSMDYEFDSDNEVKIHDLLAAARTHFKEKNLSLAKPEIVSVDIEQVGRDYVGGDLSWPIHRQMHILSLKNKLKKNDWEADFDAEKYLSMIEADTEGLLKDKEVFFPMNGAKSGSCELFQAIPKSYERLSDLSSKRLNGWHARKGVAVKLLPDITSIYVNVGKREVHFDLPGGCTKCHLDSIRSVGDENVFQLSSDLPTVKEVKEKIWSVFNLGNNLHNLCLASRETDGGVWYEQKESRDKECLIHELGLMGPVIQATLSPKLITVLVQTQDWIGNVYPIEIEDSKTIFDLKKYFKDVFLRKFIHPDKQSICFGGEILENDRSLKSYNIVNRDRLTVCKLRQPKSENYFITGREEFIKLATKDTSKISIRVILPNEQECILKVSPWMKVNCLKKWISYFPESLISCENKSAKRKISEDNADTLSSADNRIKKLRSDLLDAELKKERLIRVQQESQEKALN